MGCAALVFVPNFQCGFVLIQVKEDILVQLSLRAPVATFKTPCFRSNLFYDVKFKELLENPYDELLAFCVSCLGEGWEELKPVTFHLLTLTFSPPITNTDLQSIITNFIIVLLNQTTTILNILNKLIVITIPFRPSDIK